MHEKEWKMRSLFVFVIVVLVFSGCASKAQLRDSYEAGRLAGLILGRSECADDLANWKESAGQLNKRFIECLEAYKDK